MRHKKDACVYSVPEESRCGTSNREIFQCCIFSNIQSYNFGAKVCKCAKSKGNHLFLQRGQTSDQIWETSRSVPDSGPTATPRLTPSLPIVANMHRGAAALVSSHHRGAGCRRHSTSSSSGGGRATPRPPITTERGLRSGATVAQTAVRRVYRQGTARQGK